MSDETKSGLDAVDEGPVPSDAVSPTETRAAPDPHSHPSVAALLEKFGDAVHGHRIAAGDEHVVFAEAKRNLEILGFLRDDPDQRYDLLRDVTAVDYGGGRPLQVVYVLWSIPYRRSLRMKCELPLDALEIDSVVPLWETANWLEREVYDLFGITFRGHPDPRRILMPLDYAEGHPLRKDFPLRGRFSRAEQTRRALAQNVSRFYSAHDMEIGREPQEAVALPPAGDDAPDRET